MLNNKISYVALMMSVVIGVYSCGGDSSNEPTVAVPFSLGVSDAFVDDAENVVITIDEIRLIPVMNDEEEGSEGDDDPEREIITIPDFDGNPSVTVDLMKYAGADEVTIVSEDENDPVLIGHYRMEFVIIDEGSYVILDDSFECIVDEDDMSMAEGPGCYDIKVPSSRLRLGEFDVVLGAVESDLGPAYTVEFDLTKSLVLRGNDPAKNGFIIKPHGIRIVDSTSSGHIAGEVAFNESLECAEGTGHKVYLYEGDVTDHVEKQLTLGDLFEPAEPPVQDLLEPFARTDVVAEVTGEGTVYSYEFGFVPNGSTFEGDNIEKATYTVAFACEIGDLDDTVTYDGLMIEKPVGQLESVVVITGETEIVNFPIIVQ